MPTSQRSRREFVRASLAALSGTALAPYLTAADVSDKAKPKSDRLRIGSIGMRYQGSVITLKAMPHADLVAVCDVDKNVADQAKASFGSESITLYEDYRKLLDRKDIDAVLIATPDHWHTAMAAVACRAGKDVYCEKPLTLTVDEGKRLCKVVEETGRVFQVGTWQRSDINFRLAAELVRAGRLGKVRKVTAVAGKNVAGGPFAEAPVPPNLNWDLWQGQTPAVPYVPQRCHYTFRWWSEYSGGKVTDWGAHHLDIIQWALGVQHSGPVEVEGKARFPNVPNGYNVPTDLEAKLTYADGAEVHVLEKGRNGITFEGDAGSLFVERGAISGTAIDALKDQPLPREKFGLYRFDNPNAPARTGKLASLETHMENFFDCVKARNTRTISDVVSQHRSVTACHLINIALKLNRKLKWDPAGERFVGDDEADRMLAREQRKGYEITY